MHLQTGRLTMCPWDGGLAAGRASVDEPEIACESRRRAHGRSYATEAARAVLDTATATGRTRLWSTARGWNAPSFRVLGSSVPAHDTSTDDHGDMMWLTRAAP
jgi:hypothetical protein